MPVVLGRSPTIRLVREGLHKGPAVGIVHQRASFRELIDVRRLHFGMEIHAADPVILVVDSYEQDVGLSAVLNCDMAYENDEGYDIFHDRE